MITSSPDQIKKNYDAVSEILKQKAGRDELGLLLSFASVVYSEAPDRIALGLPAAVLAERIYRQFRFIVQTIPPVTQLYKGLPGIHVAAWNPTDEEAAALGGGAGLPRQATVVETHTLDAPYIFESLKNYFTKAGLRVYSALHPIFTVRRQWANIVWIGGPHDEGSREVYCNFLIDRIDSPERLRRIEHEVFSVLKSLFLAVEDFPRMTRLKDDIAPRLRSRRGDPEEVKSARAFLDWLADENYIYMGTTRYCVGPEKLPRRLGESAGVFSDASLLPVVFPGVVEEAESHMRPDPDDDRIVAIDFSKNATAIYHLEPIDYIVIREWAPNGNLSCANLFLGRFVRWASAQRADRIPVLKDKVEWILRNSGALPNSHLHREIRATFNRLPMRELFYASPADLRRTIEPIVFMVGDDEIVINRRDGRGYAALSLAFSRLRYSYGIEESLSHTFSEAFGPVAFHTAADCGAVSLLVFYFETSRLKHPIEIEAVRKIAQPLVTTWEARVEKVLENEFGEQAGRDLFRRYVTPETRSGLYREVTPPELVTADIRRLDALEARLELHAVPQSANQATLSLYSMRPLGLTATLGTLQNLGIAVTQELRVPLVLPDERRCHLYRFDIEAPPARVKALFADEDRFIDALRAVDEGRAADDPLNTLILDGRLAWREVELLRTFCNHLRQIRPHYNFETINRVLLRNVPVAAALFHDFAARFDPALQDRAAAVEAAQQKLQAALAQANNLIEDEILRALENLIRSSVRTNFYQRPERPVIAVKVDSSKVEGMPAPRPMFEIYVHSRLLEGIHLRGGKVARGGIRWSDRADDFRTEVLGLMKTQMVKNSIIVPVGSKGGFVLYGNVPERPGLAAYLADRYREFISGLLDITDNIVDGEVLHPPEVVRHDGDDPYLVVAADKGTAHLSDTANSVSAQYGFWLGDAFASGGSSGYDHKKVGVTARGAWECVKHHFRKLGIDVQQQSITVCGIGDMAGDVFGNGMLQSRKLKLVAVFNHQHIFIDPDPDPERSFEERRRLFNLPSSTWRSYDQTLISQGGGVFDRSAKAIAVTPEMRRLFGIERTSVSGEQMVQQILKARVDLLYNGGIGTYVKAAAETNAEVGDRANDRVRVNGAEVRARVVAEGGNLGFTQKARLEYWEQGGLINTDAVDNSAGVDLSDHEVNIKILLDLLVKKGVVANRAERDTILAEMTEQVSSLVIADNDNQATAITLDEARSSERYEEFVDLVEEMVTSGVVIRAEESIPTRQDLLAAPSRHRGLPRPLLAVLLGYSKMHAYQLAIASDLPENPAMLSFLEEYFPPLLRQRYSQYFLYHPLKREIIATAVVNHVINRQGIEFLPRLMAGGAREISAIMSSYLSADRGLLV